MVGATSTGKTTTVLEILKRRLITPWPPNVIYFYGAWQSFMGSGVGSWNSVKGNPKIDFYEGLQLDVLKKYKTPKVVVIDDLMLQQSKELAQHFISGSHHQNITTIYISHKIYVNDENYRLLSTNCQYFIIMKNRRNRSEVALLARQILGDDSKRILEAYKYITMREFGSVLLSLHNRVPEELIVTVDWLTACPSVFL